MTSTALVSSLGTEHQTIKVRRGLFPLLYMFAPGNFALLHSRDKTDDAEFCMPLAVMQWVSCIVNQRAGGPVFAEPTSLL